MESIKEGNERYELCDGLGIQARDEAGIVSVLADELQVLVGDLDFVVGDLRRELRRQNYLLLLSLLLRHHFQTKTSLLLLLLLLRFRVFVDCGS